MIFFSSLFQLFFVLFSFVSHLLSFIFILSTVNRELYQISKLSQILCFDKQTAYILHWFCSLLWPNAWILLWLLFGSVAFFLSRSLIQCVAFFILLSPNKSSLSTLWYSDSVIFTGLCLAACVVYAICKCVWIIIDKTAFLYHFWDHVALENLDWLFKFAIL